MSAAPTTVVVVPARDEQSRIAACLRALADQTVARDRFRVVLVLDACRDRTAETALGTARGTGLDLITIDGPGRGVGWARRLGMDLAADLLSPDGLIASTDADSTVAPDWLERQHAHRDRGAEAIGGLIELDAAEAAMLPSEALSRREANASARLRDVRDREPGVDHHHFAGASLSVLASVYRRVGGLEPLVDLEDAAFGRRLQCSGVALMRASDVRVTTSARRVGRARRGLAADLAAFSSTARPAGDAGRSRPYLPASARDGRAARRA